MAAHFSRYFKTAKRINSISKILICKFLLIQPKERGIPQEIQLKLTNSSRLLATSDDNRHTRNYNYRHETN